MRFVNLTPHAANICRDENVYLEIAPSGTVARLQELVLDGGMVLESIATVSVQLGMKAAGIHRADCYYPFGQIRDDQGRIVGCRTLARLISL